MLGDHPCVVRLVRFIVVAQRRDVIVTLQFSFELPTLRVDSPAEFVTSEAIADIAHAAEAAGYGAVHVTDHPAPDTRWLDHGGHHALDPFVALSFAAASTSSINLLTNIYVAAYRNPFLGAKLIQSLDVLSNGRLILGTGAGYLKPEFRALGVDFDSRVHCSTRRWKCWPRSIPATTSRTRVRASRLAGFVSALYHAVSHIRRCG